MKTNMNPMKVTVLAGYRYVDITNSPRAQVVRPDGWAPELFWVERYQARDEKWLKSSAGIKSGSDKKASVPGLGPLCILGGVLIPGLFYYYVALMGFPSSTFQFLEEIPMWCALLWCLGFSFLHPLVLFCSVWLWDSMDLIGL